VTLDLDRLERLLAAATPGPWINGERIEECASLGAEHADIYRVTEDGNCNVACATFSAADAELVCELRNAASELIALLRAPWALPDPGKNL